jgi:hypothetical protein
MNGEPSFISFYVHLEYLSLSFHNGELYLVHRAEACAWVASWVSSSGFKMILQGYPHTSVQRLE